MITVKRCSVFETNSSSSHTFTIVKQSEVKKSKYIFDYKLQYYDTGREKLEFFEDYFFFYYELIHGKDNKFIIDILRSIKDCFLYIPEFKEYPYLLDNFERYSHFYSILSSQEDVDIESYNPYKKFGIKEGDLLNLKRKIKEYVLDSIFVLEIEGYNI